MIEEEDIVEDHHVLDIHQDHLLVHLRLRLLVIVEDLVGLHIAPGHRDVDEEREVIQVIHHPVVHVLVLILHVHEVEQEAEEEKDIEEVEGDRHHLHHLLLIHLLLLAVQVLGLPHLVEVIWNVHVVIINLLITKNP